MLIQFRVENHRSLRDEQVLSLVASKENATTSTSVDGIPDRLLPAVAIYGANASGKSNVLQAMNFARHAVTMSHRAWDPSGGVPVEPFVLSEKADAPSTYEFDFIEAGVRFRYGFILSARRVEEEWLYAFPNARRQTWFERTPTSFEFGKHFHGENETIRSLTRDNSLFLSAAAQNNHPTLSPLYQWFRRIVLPSTRRTSGRLSLSAQRAFAFESSQLSLFHGMRPTSHDAAVRLLRAADIGIVDIRVEVSDKAHRQADIFVRHEGVEEQRAWLPLEWESSGTITLLGLAIPLLDSLAHGGVVCIDELESSLHPSIALELITLFNDPTTNPGKAQLVFSTHDTNLLGRNVDRDRQLQRDQIWFTEKDGSGATTLYPLTDYHPRKEENLERGYLQGRYGAIPFLGNFASVVTDRNVVHRPVGNDE